MALLVGLSAPAFADTYTYKCDVKLPVTSDITITYGAQVQLNFDTELQKVSGLEQALITVGKEESGRAKQVFVLDQAMEEATSGDRYVMLRYPEAAYGLTARLSLSDGPELPKMTVYHILGAGEQVRVTETATCTVVR